MVRTFFFFSKCYFKPLYYIAFQTSKISKPFMFMMDTHASIFFPLNYIKKPKFECVKGETMITLRKSIKESLTHSKGLNDFLLIQIISRVFTQICIISWLPVKTLFRFRYCKDLLILLKGQIFGNGDQRRMVCFRYHQLTNCWKNLGSGKIDGTRVRIMFLVIFRKAKLHQDW